MDKTCRIAVFYDGTYFNKVSNYYLYQHERQARISIAGLHEFILDQVAQRESIDRRYCHIVDAAYFRGRLTAKQALARETLYSDRLFEDVLMRANVSIHQHHIVERNGELEEKSIDVLLALEAYELASLKRYDLCVLITGDGDFVPLVRKLNTLGSRVMLLGWDFEYEHHGQRRRTRTSQQLIDIVTYPIMMTDEIDSRSRKRDPMVNQLFLPRTEGTAERPENPERQETSADRGPAERQDGPVPDGVTRHEGVIHAVVADKGFGFIRPAGAGSNIFFHASEVLDADFADLREEMAVSYAVKSTPRGPQAAAVRPGTSESPSAE